MNMPIDRQELWLVAGVVGVLVVASATGFLLSRRAREPRSRASIDNLNARIRAWWVMCGVLALAVFTGLAGSAVLFGLVSFLALREFFALVPTNRPSLPMMDETRPPS